MGFRLEQKSMSLNDLEGSKHKVPDDSKLICYRRNVRLMFVFQTYIGKLHSLQLRRLQSDLIMCSSGRSCVIFTANIVASPLTESLEEPPAYIYHYNHFCRTIGWLRPMFISLQWIDSMYSIDFSEFLTIGDETELTHTSSVKMSVRMFISYLLFSPDIPWINAS